MPNVKAVSQLVFPPNGPSNMTSGRAIQRASVAEEKAYFALPNPIVLPSGVPNIWSIRAYCESPADPPGHKQGPMASRTLDGPTSTDVPASTWQQSNDVIVLTLFDAERGKPYLEGIDASLLLRRPSVPIDDSKVHSRHWYTDERCNGPFGTLKGNPDFLPTSFRIGRFSLEAIFRLFSGRSKPENSVAVAFSKLLPPLGTFRPHVIFFHDQMSLTIANVMVEGSPSRSRDLSKFVIRLLALERHESVLSETEGCTTQMFVFCHSCHAAGTDRNGASGIQKMQRCVSCGVTWYCGPACQLKDWRRAHKDYCASASKHQQQARDGYKATASQAHILKQELQID